MQAALTQRLSSTHEGVDPGWEQIEQHFIEHDTPEIKDYAEDIDSLLVFVRERAQSLWRNI